MDGQSFGPISFTSRLNYGAVFSCSLKNTYGAGTYYRNKRKFKKGFFQYKIIECICPEELVISRLTDRKNHYSDADISIYQKIRKIYEPIKEKHIIVDTSHSLKTTIAEVVNRLQNHER